MRLVNAPADQIEREEKRFPDGALLQFAAPCRFFIEIGGIYVDWQNFLRPLV